MRHRIRHHKLPQLTPIDLLDRVAAENAVSDNCDRLACAVLDHHISSFDESAASVGHVVDDDSDAVADVADQNHAGDFIRACALFVDEGEAEVEGVCY